MVQKSRNIIEKYLRNRGFTSPESRRTMTSCILLTATVWSIGIPILPLTMWGVAFALGTLLAAINLWQIARFAQWSVTRQFTGKLVAICFFAFLFRFAGMGVILYLLLVRAKMPAIPLIAGLSSLVVWLSVTHISRIAGHSCKEA